MDSLDESVTLENNFVPRQTPLSVCFWTFLIFLGVEILFSTPKKIRDARKKSESRVCLGTKFLKWVSHKSWEYRGMPSGSCQFQDRALHFLLKYQVTLSPDVKHQLWSVYEWLGDSKWSVNLFMMFISHLKSFGSSLEMGRWIGNGRPMTVFLFHFGRFRLWST